MADPSKTEEPTGKRLTEARNKGNIARSSDATTAAILATALLAARWLWQPMGRDLESLLVRHLDRFPRTDMTPTDLFRILLADAMVLVAAAAPFCLTLLVAGIVINLVQVGPLITFETIRPNLSKLNPLNGFKRFLSASAFVELGKNFLKLLIMGSIVWGVLSERCPQLLAGWEMEPATIGPLFASALWLLASRIVLTLIVFGVADYAWQRYSHRKGLRMTKQEVKDEAKQAEGSPEVKGEIRKRMRRAALRRMMQQVPKATVVVTNPTHFAVAILYDRDTMPTPMVVAKGVDNVALRIREIASEHGVPIIENPPVARELYKVVELGDIIPPVMYQAIAEILVALQRAGSQKVAI
ncbi:MAG: flagellar biosynthesis protein FlhB [Cyanobacteria bacterium REEB65]|nr:flagellar biosynthesis protein FlhB [Cyanobacteria bacterium REEB65]